MSKVTIVAPSNIAFLKYWGARDVERAVPENPSLSMTLSECVTRTTLEVQPNGLPTVVEVAGPEGRLEPAGTAFAVGVETHLAALSDALGFAASFRVATRNSFPASAGIASSASGFAALAVAFAAVAGRDVPPGELSLLARRSGSGSAARSVFGGFVEWPCSPDDPEAPACQIRGPEHWDLRDLIAVVSSAPKPVSSRDGHRRAASSPYFARRQELLPERLGEMRRAVLGRDLERLGRAIETEAVELHLVAMSSWPPIFYWKPQTIEVLNRIWALRDAGVGVWATMDAGPNVHLVCEPADEERVAGAVGELPGVERLIRDRIGPGPCRSDDHLF
jgi:diphosphomevalonate decarboxylase